MATSPRIQTERRMTMKTKDKTTGKIIEVTPAFGGYFSCNGELIPQGDLEFNFEPPQPEAIISGWVARDGDGRLLVFRHNKPQRETMGYWDSWDDGYEYLPPDFFPDLTWEDEPIEVDIIIKPKKQ